KSPQCRFAWQVVLRPVVVLHQRAQCRLQNGVIQPFLAAEMVIDRGLVDLRRGDDGSDARPLVAVTCEGARGRFDDLVPRGLRGARHFCWLRHADSQNSNGRLNIADGDRPDKIGSYSLKKSHKRERETPVNDERLTGMLDSQVGVIADKQIAQSLTLPESIP